MLYRQAMLTAGLFAIFVGDPSASRAQEQRKPAAGPSQPFEVKDTYAIGPSNGGTNVRVEEREKPGPTGRPAVEIRADATRENSGVEVSWSFGSTVLDAKVFSIQILTPEGPVSYVRAQFLDAEGNQISRSTYFGVDARDWRALTFGVVAKSGASSIEPAKPPAGRPVARIRLQFCGRAGQTVRVVVSDFAPAGESRIPRVDTSSLGRPTLSAKDVRLWLDAARGYAIVAAQVGPVRFERHAVAVYPRFTWLDKSGAAGGADADDAGFTVKAEARGPDATAVRYSREGTTVELVYSASDGALRCDINVVEEGSLKLVAVGTDTMVGAELGRSDYGILPTGHLYHPLQGRPPQVFKRMGNCDNMVPNFGAAKLGGTVVLYKPLTASQEMNVAVSPAGQSEMVWVGGRLFFRPSRTKNPATKLCHPSLSWRLETVGDMNRDGAVDWVDCGIAVRDRYLKKNPALDRAIRDSIKFYHGIPFDTYERLAGVIEQMDYCESLWWVKGAMKTLVEPTSECHPYTVEPDPGRGDRASFRARYKTAASHVGIYYGHDYLDNANQDWPEELVKQDENGGPSRYYQHKGHQLFHKDNVRGLASGALKKHYEEIVRVCGLVPGDPVMLDTFTAYGREGYHPDFPATPQVETEAKRELCRWFKQERGMSIAGESVIEGTEDMLDFGAVFYDLGRLVETKFWTRDDWVPLPTVVYHGLTYFGIPLNEFRSPDPNWAAALVTGGCAWQWSGGQYPDLYAKGARMFFNQNLPWSRNADAKIVDVDRSGTEYRITFDNGNTLWADPGRRAWRLEAGGVLYDGFTPFNSRGVMAILKQGEFDLTLPVKEMLEILPSQPFRQKLDVTIEAAADGRIRVRGNFSKVPWKLKWYHKPAGSNREVLDAVDAEPVLLLRKKR